MNVRKHKMAVKKLFKQKHKSNEIRNKYYYDEQCSALRVLDEESGAYILLAPVRSWTQARLEVLYNEFDPHNVDLEVEHMMKQYA